MDLSSPYATALLTSRSKGNTIVVQKALSQDNIDALLKLSEDYKKSKS